MTILPPILLEAARDRKLRVGGGAVLQVLIYLHTVLSDEYYRPLKAFQVSKPLKLHRTVVQRALQRLVERGYIATGSHRHSRNVNSFMLLKTRQPPVVATEHVSEPELYRREPAA